MRTKARTDANHAEIADAFRQLGCTWQDLASVGKGCPDGIAGCSGQNLLIEVKDGSKPPSRRKLTKDQEEWHAKWRGSVHIIENGGDVEALVNKTRRGG